MSDQTLSSLRTHHYRALLLPSSRLLLLLVAGVLIVGAVGARALHKPALDNQAVATPITPSQSIIAVPLASTAMERITITTIGFDPEEMTLPAGSVTLAIDNRSGLKEVTLRLDSESGQRLIDVRVDRGELDWKGTVNLATGRYNLTEATHPAWVCQITVE